MTTNRWIGPYQARPAAELRLFCFPYAGGNASAFWGWSAAFSRDVEVCPVQLPGRATRPFETAFQSLHELVPVLADQLDGLFDRPFAFYGHSMGALLAFELAHELRARGRTQPMALFPAAHLAPAIPHRFGIAERTDLELIAYVKRMSDQPELLDHPELLRLLLPTLRSDLSVCDSYAYQRRPKLDCAVTVFGGIADSIARVDLEAWQAETTGPFAVEMLPGRHFFLNTARDALLQSLSRRLG